MFKLDRFYKGLLKRTDYFNNYWDSFPKGLFKFKQETLSLLRENTANKDGHGLSCTIAIICNDGADEDFTPILLALLDEKWHISEEDIVEILELIKDPRSIDKLYQVAINIPDYDDMRALAKKCMWALSAINTKEAIEKLYLLQKSDDKIIRENATFHIEQSLKKN